MTLLILLDSSVTHSHKENEPPSLLYQNRRKSRENPYVTRKKVPTKSSIAFSQASSSSKALSSSKATSLSTNTSQINKDSPAIQRILKATGCSSVEELLARDQQKTQANKATNQAKSAAMNRSKSTTNGSKTAATNGTTTNTTTNGGSKLANSSNIATSSAKATTRSDRSNTNQKKKSKGMCLTLLAILTPKFYVTHLVPDSFLL